MKGMDLVVTIPMYQIEDFEREIQEMQVLNLNKLFKVHSEPKMIVPGAVIYFVCGGEIRYKGEYVGMTTSGFDCVTTGKSWKGQFLEITRIKPVQPDERKKMIGFQGYRYKNW